MNKEKFKEEVSQFLLDLGKALVPNSFRADLTKYLSSAGIRETPYRLFSVLFFVGLVGTLITFFYFDIYNQINQFGLAATAALTAGFFLVSGTSLLAILAGAVYFVLDIKIYNRTMEIEENFAEYLVLVTTNLKGGLSFEESLWTAIKPEFGVLSEEMSIVSKEVLTGGDLEESLFRFVNKYDSPTLTRTVQLIAGEVETGGRIAYLLDDIIDNLRKSKALKDELSANTLSFIIFIGAIVIVISPVLFALAFNLMEILLDVTDIVANAGGDGGEFGLDVNDIDLNPDLFEYFSMVALGVTSLFASMIISIIKKGDIKGGVKYLPFFIISTLVVYQIAMNMLSGLFSIA